MNINESNLNNLNALIIGIYKVLIEEYVPFLNLNNVSLLMFVLFFISLMMKQCSIV